MGSSTNQDNDEGKNDKSDEPHNDKGDKDKNGRSDEDNEGGDNNPFATAPPPSPSLCPGHIAGSLHYHHPVDATAMPLWRRLGGDHQNRGANESGQMGAGEHEQGRVSANKGGGATAAAAATAGPPSPFYLFI